METQQKKLLNALILVVENLQHPEVLQEVVKALGTRHVNYGLLRQHYPLVGKALLQTLKQYLQENWTPEIKAAWIYADRGITKLMLQAANYPSERERSPTTDTTNLSKANLSNVNLSHANLVCADLSNANMSGVNLTGASLSGANIKETYLVAANLKDAKVSINELSNTYLKDAIIPNFSKYKST